MRNLVLITLLGASSLSATATTPLWMRDANISPDGKEIVFTYKGDIYKVSANGGNAVQLTTQDSYESSPVWSPDGRRFLRIVTSMVARRTADSFRQRPSRKCRHIHNAGRRRSGHKAYLQLSIGNAMDIHHGRKICAVLCLDTRPGNKRNVPDIIYERALQDTGHRRTYGTSAWHTGRNGQFRQKRQLDALSRSKRIRRQMAQTPHFVDNPRHMAIRHNDR